MAEQLKTRTRPILVIGDGAALCCTELSEQLPLLQLAPTGLCDQHAVGVARAAVPMLEAGNMVSGDALQPQYLRLPQAERELRRRQAEQNT